MKVQKNKKYHLKDHLLEKRIKMYQTLIKD